MHHSGSTFSSFALQCVLLASIALPSLGFAQSVATGTLILTVRDSGTHFAVRAQIIIAGPKSITAETDDTGMLQVGLPASQYWIEVLAPGYRTMRTRGSVGAGETTPVGIMLDPTTPPKEQQLLQSSLRNGFTVMHGYAVDDSGRPVPGVAVRLLHQDGKAVTNDRGYYELSVPTPPERELDIPGTDTLIAQKPGYKTIVHRNIIVAGRDGGGWFLDMKRGKGTTEFDDTHKLMRNNSSSVTVECGKRAPLKLEAPMAKAHASRIRAAVQRCPNFAGHYTVASWGCGAECAAYVIVDNLSGEIYEPPEISRGISLGVGGPEFRPDSTLMVVANCPEPKVYGLKGCNRQFYRWNGSRLLLIGSEPMTEKGKASH